MQWVCALMLVAVVPSYAVARAQAKSAPAKSTHAKPVAHHTVHGSTARTRRTRAASAPSYQLHPDPDRYQDIQKALADRGYFRGEVNGDWRDDSVVSLKRFQSDQKLPDDGKISALSLIALGLGPKHDLGASNPAAAPALPLRPDAPSASTSAPPTAHPQ